MRNGVLTALLAVVAVPAAGSVQAHFGMVIPSDNMVMPDDPRTIQVVLPFSHPFERVGMELVRPERFEVVAGGRRTDLTDTLAVAEVMGKRAWRIDYPVKRPALHVFWMQPQPYWESVEDCFIVHYTKTVVVAFGQDDGWDAEIGESRHPVHFQYNTATGCRNTSGMTRELQTLTLTGGTCISPKAYWRPRS